VLDLSSGKLVWNRRHPWQEGTCTVKQARQWFEWASCNLRASAVNNR
jgi:hypothetical protein